MIRIAITQAAFEAIARTLPLGNVIREQDRRAGPAPDLAGPGDGRPIFYSLPQRRCYARHGVDRPASRHAGLHSASTSLPCSMDVQPCSSQ